MAPRAYWKGYLKLSLVSCPIQLFPAISEREKIRFHQINRKTGNRIKYCKLDAVTGKPVSDEDIIKGYEVGKGRYIEITGDELESVAIGSTHTIEIDQFVPRSEIDELYWNIPYYIAPDGEVGGQAFAVIREAIRKEGMVALGHVVFTTREHVVAVEPRGKGMLGVTLRYPYDFEPEKFEDHYENALKQLIKKKQRGEKIEKPKERPPAQVINLMEALKRSATAERSAVRSHPRRAATHHQRTSANRSNARARKAS